MKLHSLVPSIGTKKAFILLFYFLIVSAITTVSGATKTWIGTNSTWGTSSNWSPSGVPATGDNVIIAFTSGGNYPIISSTITVESLTVNATAFLTVNTSANLSISSFLNVNGILTINDGTIDQGTDHGGGDDFYGTGTVNMYNGTFKVGHDFRATGTFNGTGGLVNFTGNGGGNAWTGAGTTQFYNVLINASLNPKIGTKQYVTFSVSGNWTNNSNQVDLISKGSKVIFNGTGAQTIGGSQTTKFSDVETSGSASTKSLAINTEIASNLSILSGTLDLLTYTINRVSGGGTISIATGATLKIGGTNTFPSNYTNKSFGSPGIVEYSGTNQIIANLDYADLTLSGSGTKTFPALGVNSGNVTSNPILGIGTLRILNNTLKVILPNNSTNDEGYFSTIYRNYRRYRVNELIFGTGSSGQAIGYYGGSASPNSLTDASVVIKDFSSYLTSVSPTNGYFYVALGLLPVTLTSFTAKPAPNRTVSLNWATASETVNKGFRIERQAGNITGKYESLGFVSSKANGGNSQVDLYYNFMDVSPRNEETSYYRLAQEDLDGKTTFSEVRVVKLSGQTVSMVYPNPSNGAVNISRTADGRKMNILVLDMTGRMIQQFNNIIDSNYKLNISKSGMYNIKIIYPETGEQSTQRIVIER